MAAYRWEALLEGCPNDVVKCFVDTLVAEGLDPEDSASLVELTPQLLDALHLNDHVARERVLAVAQSATDRGRNETAVLANPAEDKEHVPLCITHFEGRVFAQTDRRGAQAQEVVPGVFLGSFKAAMNTEEQQRLGITHIVNATSHQLDAPGARVLCLFLRDCDGDQDISKDFPRVIKFIDEARAAGSAVLVHCVRGVSRSSALVCAYIMARSDLDAQDALTLVQKARPVAKPRPGFVQQLKVFKQQLTNRPIARANVICKPSADDTSRQVLSANEGLADMV